MTRKQDTTTGNDTILASIVAHVIETEDNLVVPVIAERVVDALRLQAQNGSAECEGILQDLAVKGCHVVARAALRAERARVTHDGTVMDIPARWAARVIDAVTGKPNKYSQLKLWFEMSWPEFITSLERDEAQAQGTLARTSWARDVILPLRERFPESQTTGEACKLAGIDPHALIVEDEQAV